jgi:hypothetical protein
VAGASTSTSAPFSAAQADLAFVQFDAHELGRHHARLPGHQVVGQGVRERRLFQREEFDAQGVQAGDEPVRAGLQHAVEIAIAQQQAALVLLHSDTLDRHGVLLGLSACGIGAVTAAAADDGCQGSDSTVRVSQPPP